MRKQARDGYNFFDRWQQRCRSWPACADNTYRIIPSSEARLFSCILKIDITSPFLSNYSVYYILCVTSIHQNCLIVCLVINGLYCTSIRGHDSAERVHHYSSSSKLKPRFICFLWGILQTMSLFNLYSLSWGKFNKRNKTMRAETKFCQILFQHLLYWRGTVGLNTILSCHLRLSRFEDLRMRSQREAHFCQISGHLEEHCHLVKWEHLTYAQPPPPVISICICLQVFQMSANDAQWEQASYNGCQCQLWLTVFDSFNQGAWDFEKWNSKIVSLLTSMHMQIL